MRYGVVFLLAILGFSSAAMSFSEKAVYARCYAQLTGKTVPFNDANYKDVATGKMSGVNACKALLHVADMDAAGNLKNAPDARAGLVLNNFYQFHRTWFPTGKQEQIVGYRAEFESNTFRFIDMSEPSLYLTRNLFSGDSYRDVLSGSKTLEGKRSKDPAAKSLSLSFINANGTIMVPGQVFTNYVFANNAGPLKAINDFAGSFPLTNYNIPGVGNAVSVSAIKGANANVDFFANLGGGIIGTRAFFLLNSGHPQGQIFDGSLKLPRKWSKTAMESLLCLSLPALRESDVLKFVDANSTSSFRQAASCIRCHASMDQMAYTARNLVVSLTVGEIRSGGANLNTKSNMIGKFNETKASVVGWPSTTIPDFQMQKPDGAVYYRSFSNGELVNKPVSGIEQLGEALADTNDFYQCAAKRYFEYFTGINVSLYDRSDPANASLNKSLNTRDIEDRKFVETLGKDLRTNQSLQKMIEAILSSSYYRSSIFSSTEE